MAGTDADAENIGVEVAFALPERQLLIPVTVPKGTTVEQAIVLSGILEQFSDIDPATSKTGIFGRLCPRERVLEAGDRVEIYRPLVADPKEVRRRLAAEGRTMGQSRERKSEE